MTDDSPIIESTPPRSGWRLILRGLEVRLRFILALGLLAALMAGWPWLRGAWERVASNWHTHRDGDAVSGDSEFFCPMDPGVISAWPAICPICNMDLIPRKKADAVLLPEGVVARMQLSPYRVQLAGIRTVPVLLRPNPLEGSSEATLVVPVDAVVNHGGERIVYVETMPGMFDGVRVELGPRSGDVYPILAGLKANQRVVAAGAFLVDAESRLNPNLAVQYFGANAQTASTKPAPPKRTETKPPLSAADQKLVEQQRVCPVTEAKLGSMGQPVFTMVQGRKVALCCRGCESTVLADPEKYLARLNSSNDDMP